MTASGVAWQPLILATVASCLFGVSTVLAKRGLAHVDPHTGSIITIGTCMTVFSVTGPWWMRAADWFTPGFWVFVLNGLMHPMLSMYLALEAQARTGPTVAATFASTAPLFAGMTAVVFLGESLNLVIVAGTLGTVAGIMTLSWSPGGVTTLTRAALLFATGAAVVRGLNHSIGRFGLELLPNVFMASFVSFSVSFVGSVILFRLRRGRLPSEIPRPGLAFFVTAGGLIAVAVSCMYGALATGTVVLVSPIVATYPVFTLITGSLLGDERPGPRLLAGVALAVAGVVLISFGTARSG